MKIIGLRAENFKKIKAVAILPQGETVILSGKNGQGKTSVLDSILVALGGTSKAPIKPIREGAEKAEIILDLGKYQVRRTFTDKGSYLEVLSDGAKFSSPQKLLDEMMGDLSFDPLEFAKKPAKEQRQTLIELTGLDFSKEDAERKKLFEERTMVGREGQNLPQHSLEAIAEAEQYATQEEVSISGAVYELNKAVEHNRNYYGLENKANSYREKLLALELELESVREDYKKALEELRATSAVDTEPLQAKIDTAEQTNAKIRQAKAVVEDVIKVKAKRDEYVAITKTIDEIDMRKKDMLAKVKMPIAGLDFTEDGVTFNGIPFSQISSAEQLKVSLSIAMAMNPKLRVVRITDGSLLDDDNMKVIQEMATAQDFQVWIEVVSSEGKTGFYIEDGEIASIDGVRVVK